jgi:hypothetical protein
VLRRSVVDNRRRIVSGSGYADSTDNTVRVWDAQTGAETAVLRGHENVVGSVAFSPDGRRIVSGSWDAWAQSGSTLTGTIRDGAGAVLAGEALRRGFVDEERLEECRRFGERFAPGKPLPQLLLEKGYLTIEQFGALVVVLDAESRDRASFGERALREAAEHALRVVQPALGQLAGAIRGMKRRGGDPNPR